MPPLQKTWVLSLFLFPLLQSNAFAHQKAKVTATTAEIHTLPSEEAPPAGELKQGETVQISSKWVTDNAGHNWYKISLPTGGFGYVEANNLETETVKRELASVKIHPNSGHLEEIPIAKIQTWRFVLRGMATVIFMPFVSTSSLVASGQSRSLGGELEFTYSLPLAPEGDFAHLIALGTYLYGWGANPLVLGGVVVFRPSLQLSYQPELRVRVADFSSSTGPLFSAAGAIQIPFSLRPGAHSSGYLEVGMFGSQSFAVDLPFFSFGMGYHF